MSSLSSLVIADAIILTSISCSATALGHFFGRAVDVLQPTDLKRFAFSTLVISLSGIVGRELSLNIIERRNNNKKPLVRYISLTLGIAGMTAALTQKVSCFRFNWNGIPFKENIFSAAITAGSMCLFDHYMLFPIKKNEVTQEEVDQSVDYIYKRINFDIGKDYDGSVVKSAKIISSKGIGMENVESELKEGYLKLKKQTNIANRYGIQINITENNDVIQFSECALGYKRFFI